MQPMQSYTESFTVQQSECDFANRMMPAALLRRAQQIAIDHCDAIGLTDEVYRRTGTAFLLAKAAVEVRKPIETKQRLRMETFPAAARRAVYNRLTIFYNEAGEETALCDSRWILVDMASRRILRAAPPELNFPFIEPPKRELDFALPRLPLQAPRELTAGYSLCDCNRHINNARYADLACDMLPTALLEQRPIRRMVLAYHSEVPMGGRFTLAAAPGEEGYWYVSGVKEEKRCLEVGVWLG